MLTYIFAHRKLDLRIIPGKEYLPLISPFPVHLSKLTLSLAAFWLLYFLCSGIRSNIGIAQTMNRAQGHDLMTMLSLTAKDTSTALALFYVAYVIFDFPS